MIRDKLKYVKGVQIDLINKKIHIYIISSLGNMVNRYNLKESILNKYIEEVPDEYKEEVVNFLRGKQDKANNEGGKKYWKVF